MSKGYFVDQNGKMVFFGNRLTKESLEENYIWVELTPSTLHPGKDYVWDGREWVLDYELETARLWIEIREKRNKLLQETDWTQLSDIKAARKNTYVAYRQELRDIPQTFEDPRQVIWPEKPIESKKS